MNQHEKIEGQKLNQLFDDLLRNQVLMKVFVDGSDYERLTVVTDLKTDDKEDLFRINAPKGLQSALSEKQTTLLGFEFTGKDRLTHKFECRVQQATPTDIWLTYPRHIRRYQFRNNFRIKAPRGADLLVTLEEIDLQMTIDNISLGGAFCLCSNQHKQLIEANPLITDLTLVFTHMDQRLEVPIIRAERRRIQQVSRPKKFGVAYEFVKINKGAKRLLTRQIYELQREYLQNRLKIGE